MSSNCCCSTAYESLLESDERRNLFFFHVFWGIHLYFLRPCCTFSTNTYRKMNCTRRFNYDFRSYTNRFWQLESRNWTFGTTKGSHFYCAGTKILYSKINDNNTQSYSSSIYGSFTHLLTRLYVDQQ